MIGAILAFLFCGCESEIDMEYHEIEPLPVIEATLTDDGASVLITYTTPMNEPMNNAAVVDADVTLKDLTSGQEYLLTADSDGIFRSKVEGCPGHDYEVVVTMNGQCYRSVCRMLPPSEISHLQFHWIAMPGDDMAGLQILFTDNPLTEDYYWVRLYRNGEPYSMNIITDRAQSGGIIEEVMTTTHRDPSQENDAKQLLTDGDTMTATITPISRQMFDYLNALMNNSNGAPQFESKGKCLGYFLASPVASASVIYHPDEIQYAQ